MNNGIIKKDTRLLLFRTLEYGIKADLADQAFIDRFNREGSKMSFVFAKRYYNVVYEANLRHASHCVLGVMNIGLIEAANNSLHNAVDLVQRKGFVGVFREGWSCITDLVQRAKSSDNFNLKTEFEWEIDFAASMSAEPGKKWVGYDEYRYYLSLYSKTDRK